MLHKICFTFFIFISVINSVFSKNQSRIKAKDLKPIYGFWYGSLTYMDYSTDKPFIMPANIHIIRINKTNKFIFTKTYPDEPKANSSDTLILSNDRKMINQESIKSILKTENGNMQIVTEYKGTDGNDNQSATIRYIYTIGKQTFITRKEVKFDDKNEWIMRHEYSYFRFQPLK